MPLLPFGNPPAKAISGSNALIVAASNASQRIKNGADYVCTGANDDGQINAALAANRYVKLSFGTFNLGAPIGLTVSNTTLEAAGVATRLLVQNGANLQAAISITGTGVVECKVRKLWIDGNKSNQSNGDGIYIKTPWATTDTQHTFEDIYITNCKNNGLEFGINGDTRVVLMNRVHIKNCDGNGWYAPFPSQTDGIFNDVIVDTCGLNGFYVGGINNHYTNCKSFYNGTTGGSNHGFNIISYNNYFNQCESQNNYQAGYYSNATGGDATYQSFGCTFVNCIGSANGQNGGQYAKGLMGVNVKQWQIIGGIWFNDPYDTYWQDYGISFEGSAINNVVKGATFAGNNKAPYQDTSSGPNFISSNNDTNWKVQEVSPLDYGAKGDGQRVFATVASTASPNVTSTNAAFTSADVGKIAIVYNDSSAGTVTTIQSVTDATHAVLAANAGITTTSGNGYLIYGTDDSLAIQNALNGAAALAKMSNANDPNQPIGSGHILCKIPGLAPQSFFLIANQIAVPGGVELDCVATIANVLTSRNFYAVKLSAYSRIRKLLLENLFGTGVTAGSNGAQAHIIIDDIRVWHSAGTATGPTGLSGATSTTGGTLSANTRYYVVTAIDSSGGETVISNEVSITSTGATSSNTLNWTAFAGAVSYKIYRGTTSGAQNLYYTSATNSYVDTGAANTSAYPIAPGVALQLLGYHYEISRMYLKIATLGAYHWAGSDCTVNSAYFVGCTTALRANATNQLSYANAKLDTCGGTGSLGGVVIDNGCSNVTINGQAFQVAGTSGSLSPVVNIGPLSTTSKNTDIRIWMMANNTGGIGLSIANAQDVMVDQLLSNDTFASGINNPITTAVAYGANLAAEINIRTVASTSVTTLTTGTPVGTHEYQQNGIQHFSVAPVFDAGASMNNQKLTNLANGASVSDAATFGQIPWLTNFLAPAGATAETWPRTLAMAVAYPGITSGTLYLNAVGLPKGLVVNNLSFFIGNTAEAGGSHGWFVLLDSSFIVRAVSADQTGATAFNGTFAMKTLAMAAGYTTTSSGLYYIGFCVTATTMPTFLTNTPSITNLMSTAPALMGTSSTGQTTPPAIGTTMSTITANAGNNFYGYTS